jgi:hypothetical protein
LGSSAAHGVLWTQNQPQISAKTEWNGHCSIITKYSGDALEQELWFERGSESLIALVLKELAKNSGQLVLMDTAGGDPIVISAAV